MRRFDDFLKLLLAIVVGQFFRESTDIATTVSTIAPTVAHWIAEGMAFLLAALAIRNVHASIRYDTVCKALNSYPSYEDSRGGRAFGFAVVLLTTVVAPALTEHLFASHEEFLTGRQGWWVLILFGPYVFYTLWDVAIWLTSVETKRPYSPIMERVIGRWLLIDGFHIAALIVWWYLLLANRANVINVDLSWMLEGFFFVGVVTIAADYWLNRQFYFDEFEPAAEAEEETANSEPS